MDESAIYGRLGDMVRRHRERLEMTQETLASAIGLSRASVANIETGRQRIPLHHLYRLASALKVEAQALLPTIDAEAPAEMLEKISSSVDLSQLEEANIARVVRTLGLSNKRDLG